MNEGAQVPVGPDADHQIQQVNAEDKKLFEELKKNDPFIAHNESLQRDLQQQFDPNFLAKVTPEQLEQLRTELRMRHAYWQRNHMAKDFAAGGIRRDTQIHALEQAMAEPLLERKEIPKEQVQAKGVDISSDDGYIFQELFGTDPNFQRNAELLAELMVLVDSNAAKKATDQQITAARTKLREYYRKFKSQGSETPVEPPAQPAEATSKRQEVKERKEQHKLSDATIRKIRLFKRLLSDYELKLPLTRNILSILNTGDQQEVADALKLVDEKVLTRLEDLLKRTESRNAFNVLNVALNSTDEEIRYNYRQMITLLHPDSLVGLEDRYLRLAERIAKNATNAYSVLSNPNQKYILVTDISQRKIEAVSSRITQPPFFRTREMLQKPPSGEVRREVKTEVQIINGLESALSAAKTIQDILTILDRLADYRYVLPENPIMKDFGPPLSAAEVRDLIINTVNNRLDSNVVEANTARLPHEFSLKIKVPIEIRQMNYYFEKLEDPKTEFSGILVALRGLSDMGIVIEMQTDEGKKDIKFSEVFDQVDKIYNNYLKRHQGGNVVLWLSRVPSAYDLDLKTYHKIKDKFPCPAHLLQRYKVFLQKLK